MPLVGVEIGFNTSHSVGGAKYTLFLVGGASGPSIWGMVIGTSRSRGA